MAHPKAHFFTPETDVAPKSFRVLTRGRKWLTVAFPCDAQGVINQVLIDQRTEDWRVGEARTETLVTVVTSQNRYGVVWHFEAVEPSEAPLIALKRLLHDVQNRRAAFRGHRVTTGAYRAHDVTCHRLEDAQARGWFDLPGATGLRKPVLDRLMTHLGNTAGQGGRDFVASCRAFRALGGLTTPHASVFLALEARGQQAFTARTAKDRILVPLTELDRYPLNETVEIGLPHTEAAQLVVPVRVGDVVQWSRFNKARAKAFADHEAWFEHVRAHLLGIDLVNLYLREATDEERTRWEAPRLRATLLAEEAGTGAVTETRGRRRL